MEREITLILRRYKREITSQTQDEIAFITTILPQIESFRSFWISYDVIEISDNNGFSLMTNIDKVEAVFRLGPTLMHKYVSFCRN